MKKSLTLVVVAAAATSVVAGCGGGATGAGPTRSTITGVASLGAQVAVVVAIDASTPSRQAVATVQNDGSFSVDVSGLTPPFLLKAVPISASIDSQYAIATGPGRTPINAVTTLAVLGASGAGGTAALGTAAGLQDAAGGFDAVLTQLGAVLRPLLERYGIRTPISIDDAAGIGALLQDVRFSVHGETLIITSAATGAVIFQGSLSDLAAGTFDAASLPTPGAGNAPTTPTTGAPDGAALYAQRCASCHGDLASSDVRGKSAAAITSSKMTYGLSAAEVDAVALALAGSSSGSSSGGTALDGVALYNRFCGSCHGPISSSSIAGQTLEEVAKLMGMGLSLDKLQAIIDAVTAATAGAQPPSTSPSTGTDGAALYAQRCASCHGDLASSGVRGTTAAAIQASNMTYGLSAPQVDAVVQALNSGSTSGGNCGNTLDGVALYNKYCAMCHGAISKSSLVGAAVDQISKFMSAGLNLAQLQALVDALNGGTGNSCSTPTPTPTPNPGPTPNPNPSPAPTGTDGAALYAQSCARCHGALSASDVHGTTVTRVNQKNMTMGLSQAQVAAVVEALQ
jgi:mono/diheme cytochrome c family protein